MKQDRQDWIRREVRPRLAGAIHHCITALAPLLEAHERGKTWSEAQRFAAVDEIDVLMATVASAATKLDELPEKGKLSRVDKQRFTRAFNGMAGAVRMGRELSIEKMVALDKKRARAGQSYFVALLRELMLVLRHALAALFYLVNDATMLTIRLDKKTTNDYRYGSEGAKAGIEANFEAAARHKAVESGSFVEVIAYDGEVLYDASPHAATIRREMGLAERREKKAWPYAANPRRKDYDVLIELYKWKLLE